MSERETALQITERIIREHDTFCVGHYLPDAAWCSCAPSDEPRCDSCRALAEKITEAIDAAASLPPDASPQTGEVSPNVRALTVHICEDCLNLRGEMCNEPGCRFCRRTMAEVAEYLDALLIRPRIDGVSVLIDEGTPLPSPVSPVEPTPAEEPK